GSSIFAHIPRPQRQPATARIEAAVVGDSFGSLEIIVAPWTTLDQGHAILSIFATTRENRCQVCRSLRPFASPGAGQPKQRTPSPSHDLRLKTAERLHLDSRCCAKGEPLSARPSVVKKDGRHRRVSISRNQQLCDERASAYELVSFQSLFYRRRERSQWRLKYCTAFSCFF